MERHNLYLLNKPNKVITIAKRGLRSSIINLVFLNIPKASTIVEVHLTIGSLHYTISIKILN